MNKDVNNSRSQSDGIIPAILKALVFHCCGACKSGNGQSVVDFSRDGNGNAAKKSGVIEVKDSLSVPTSITFPITGTMDQEVFHGSEGTYQYIPVMEKPGIAFIVAKHR